MLPFPHAELLRRERTGGAHLPPRRPDACALDRSPDERRV